MVNANTSSQLMDIATRIKGMREILGYSSRKMAEQTEVTEETYRQYESGTVDLPFTFLHKCAKAFGVEMSVLRLHRAAHLSRFVQRYEEPFYGVPHPQDRPLPALRPRA